MSDDVNKFYHAKIDVLVWASSKTEARECIANALNSPGSGTSLFSRVSGWMYSWVSGSDGILKRMMPSNRPFVYIRYDDIDRRPEKYIGHGVYDAATGNLIERFYDADEGLSYKLALEFVMQNNYNLVDPDGFDIGDPIFV